MQLLPYQTALLVMGVVCISSSCHWADSEKPRQRIGYSCDRRGTHQRKSNSPQTFSCRLGGNWPVFLGFLLAAEKIRMGAPGISRRSRVSWPSRRACFPQSFTDFDRLFARIQLTTPTTTLIFRALLASMSGQSGLTIGCLCQEKRPLLCF